MMVEFHLHHFKTNQFVCIQVDGGNIPEQKV